MRLLSGYATAEQVTTVATMAKNHKSLARFGFRFERGGAHSSRTMMLDELAALLGYVDREDASKGDYLRAVEEDNCLAKRSEEHTSELQSRENLVCRLLLEKKKNNL